MGGRSKERYLAGIAASPADYLAFQYVLRETQMFGDEKPTTQILKKAECLFMDVPLVCANVLEPILLTNGELAPYMMKEQRKLLAETCDT